MDNTTIIKLSNGDKIEVASWVIDKNCDNGLMFDLAGGILKIAKETEKAILLKGTYRSFWIPKSQIA